MLPYLDNQTLKRHQMIIWLGLVGCLYLQEELCPVPQVVRENSSVKGLDAFFIEPALTAGVILRQLLKVRPAGHLNRGETKDNLQLIVISEKSLCNLKNTEI